MELASSNTGGGEGPTFGLVHYSFTVLEPHVKK